MEEKCLPDYIRDNHEVFDRFTFDHLFKKLLADGYDHEEAKDMILYNCFTSTLVSQERLDNDFYLEISAEDEMAPDLSELKREIACQIIENKILEIL